jgi:gamma-glutamylcyclotransferase (GGCT)/AIG2-like uncharacterized protein YtfP
VAYLFAYGTLQDKRVQLASFGRRLRGTPDAMRGFELVPLEIDDPVVIETSGKVQHTMARRTGCSQDIIRGTVFEVTSRELAAADTYEVPAVDRTEVRLESGLSAGVYVEAESAGSQP